MKTTICEVCKRSVPLTSDLLASAAMDLLAVMRCQCGATIEACYVDHQLLTATAPRVIQFGAAGPMTFSPMIERGAT